VDLLFTLVITRGLFVCSRLLQVDLLFTLVITRGFVV
jgi:hypothetical protein